MLLGPNGIITIAQKAKEETENAIEDEKDILNSLFDEDIEPPELGGEEPAISEYMNIGDIYYYSPDLSGFNKTNTWYITYDENGNNETIYGRADRVKTPEERMA